MLTYLNKYFYHVEMMSRDECSFYVFLQLYFLGIYFISGFGSHQQSMLFTLIYWLQTRKENKGVMKHLFMFSKPQYLMKMSLDRSTEVFCINTQLLFLK